MHVCVCVCVSNPVIILYNLCITCSFLLFTYEPIQNARVVGNKKVRVRKRSLILNNAHYQNPDDQFWETSEAQVDTGTRRPPLPRRSSPVQRHSVADSALCEAIRW